MSRKYPILLIGGRPNRGKSVVSYIISALLKTRHIPHYLLRATPDGEGNWYQQAAPAVGDALRAQHKRSWDPAFESRLETVLSNPVLPYLVDTGGKPTRSQIEQLFACGTHSIWVGATEAEFDKWRGIGHRLALHPVAEVVSRLDGNDRILETNGTLRIQLGHLERQRSAASASSAPWQRLVACVAEQLTISGQQPWARYRHQPPAESQPINVRQWLIKSRPGSQGIWRFADLDPLLAALPTEGILALYDAKPLWLLSAIALHNREALMYTFHAQDRWLQIPQLFPQEKLGGNRWEISRSTLDGVTKFSVSFPSSYLKHAPQLGGPLPPIAEWQPLLLSGKMPAWFCAALARHYADQRATVAIDIPAEGRALIINGPQRGRYLP